MEWEIPILLNLPGRRNQFIIKMYQNIKKIRIVKLIIIQIVSSILSKIDARLLGIQLGSNCKFYGRTFFQRYDDSSIKIGDSCIFRSLESSNLIGINHKCIIATHRRGAKIVISDNCGLSGTVVASFMSVYIGENVKCGANTLITDSDWHSDDLRSGTPRPIIIERNVWLGEGSKILKGVTIGENSVIGAGSIVTKNIPRNVIAGGNPCRVLKALKSND